MLKQVVVEMNTQRKRGIDKKMLRVTEGKRNREENKREN
jgi:hypothetical protein